MSRKKTVIGSYEVLKEIGEGGFATTYMVRHQLLDELACLKQNLDLSKEEAEALRKEAKLLWNVHHHSLPTLRDFIPCDDGSFALVMTFVAGKDLYKVVAEDYPSGIDPEHVCWMTQRLLNALHYLHYYGIIHNDVKPQNIIIKPEEHNAILVDYGLSTVRPKRKMGCPGCTPAFAAPEQLEGKTPIPETDIFGLGVSMIYALGGNFVAKTYPSHIPTQMRDYFNQMVLYNPLERPRYALDLLRPLVEMREKLFGSKSSGKTLKIS